MEPQAGRRRHNRDGDDSDDGGGPLAKRRKASLGAPPIIAFMEDANDLGIPDHTLSSSKLELYRNLHAELERISEGKVALRGEPRKRMEDDHQNVLVAIGYLFVMDDGLFEAWLKNHPIKSHQTLAFIFMHSAFARRAIDDCKLNLLLDD